MTPDEIGKRLADRAIRSLLGRRNDNNKKTAQQISEDLKNTVIDSTRHK